MNPFRPSAPSPVTRAPGSCLILALLTLGGCASHTSDTPAAPPAAAVVAPARHTPPRTAETTTSASPATIPAPAGARPPATSDNMAQPHGALPSNVATVAASPDEPAPRADTYRPAHLPEIALTAPIVYEILAADIALQRQQPDAAYATYQSLAAQTGDARLARRATEIAIVSGALPNALDSARLWARLDPNLPDARKALDTLLLANGRISEVEPALRRQLAQARQTHTLDSAYRQLQSKLLNLPNHAAAWALLQRLSAPDLENAQARLTRARLAHDAGQQQAATDEAVAALRLAPDNIEAVLACVQLQQQQPGGRQRASALLNSYLQRHPDDLRALKALGLLQIASEQTRAAIDTLQRVQAAEPQDPATLYTLAQLYNQLRDYPHAVDALQRYVALPDHIERDNGNALLFLAEIAQQQHDLDAAIQQLERVPPNSPVHFEAQVTRASLLARLVGRPGAGLAILHRLSPQTTRQRQLLKITQAQILRDAGRFHDAFSVLDAAVHQSRSRADTLDLLYDHAIAAEKINRLDILEKDLTQLINARPDDGNAYNALGYTLADHNKRLPEALALIEKANRLLPNNPQILDSLGWVYFRLGRLRESLDIFARLWEKSPETELGCHYGEVLWAHGDQAAARDVWRQARRQDPHNELLQSTLKRLGVTL